jgi:ABC-type sugar transport system ATPase subunit
MVTWSSGFAGSPIFPSRFRHYNPPHSARSSPIRTGEASLESNLDAPVTLEVTELSGAGILRDVSLTVRKGEILGVYGFMGSGQIELARAIAGKLPTDKGTVQIEGKVVRLRNTAVAKRAGVALLPESRRSMLFPREPVYKNISTSILERFWANFIKCMFWSGEWSSPALCSQDRGPKLGSGCWLSG